MADLPDFYVWTEAIMPVKITLDHGLDANKSTAPVVGEAYAATDTNYFYLCLADGVWTKVAAEEILDHTAIAAAHHAKYLDAEAVTAMGAKADDNPLHHDKTTKYTDAEAKAAAVQAGAITNGVTKAPTHDAVYDVKVTADTATTPAEVDAKILTHKNIAAAHHAKTVDASELTAGTLPTARLAANVKILTITFIIDGGGSAITTGQKGHLRIPFACAISRVTMLADQSGSIVVDIWKDTYANFPPDNADSITAAAPPTITTAQKSEDSTLTGWTTAIAAGDILAFNVDSITDIERITISLKVTKT